MAVLILSRLGPGAKYATNFLEWLSEYPEPKYMFTDSKYADQFTGYAQVKGFNNYDANGLVEIEAVKFGKKQTLSHVIALDERDLLRAARIREELGISGQSVESATAYRHKPTMKSYVKASGIPCPKYSVIDSPMDLYRFIVKNGLPVIVKPQDGFGSINTKIIHNWEQAEKFMGSAVFANMMVESFVDGEMYQSNGLIMDGKMVFLSVAKYGTVPLSRISGSGLSYTLSPSAYLIPQSEKIFGRIYEFTDNVIQSLPSPKNSSFHCELFHTADDELVFCEIASRTGGAKIGECILQAYGVDLNAEWSRLECGLDVTIPQHVVEKQLAATYLIPTRPGKLTSMLEEIPLPWVIEYLPRVKVGDEIHVGKTSMDTLGSIVFVGASNEELMHRFDQLCDLINNHIIVEEIKS